MKNEKAYSMLNHAAQVILKQKREIEKLRKEKRILIEILKTQPKYYGKKYHKKKIDQTNVDQTNVIDFTEYNKNYSPFLFDNNGNKYVAIDTDSEWGIPNSVTWR